MKKFFISLLILALLIGGGLFWAIKKYFNTEEIEARVVAGGQGKDRP